jgi:hypothetical protein
MLNSPVQGEVERRGILHDDREGAQRLLLASGEDEEKKIRRAGAVGLTGSRTFDTRAPIV